MLCYIQWTVIISFIFFFLRDEIDFARWLDFILLFSLSEFQRWIVSLCDFLYVFFRSRSTISHLSTVVSIIVESLSHTISFQCILCFLLKIVQKTKRREFRRKLKTNSRSKNDEAINERREICHNLLFITQLNDQNQETRSVLKELVSENKWRRFINSHNSFFLFHFFDLFLLITK